MARKKPGDRIPGTAIKFKEFEFANNVSFKMTYFKPLGPGVCWRFHFSCKKQKFQVFVAHIDLNTLAGPSFFFFFKIFDVDHFLKSLLNLLQYCFCFYVLVFLVYFGM